MPRPRMALASLVSLAAQGDGEAFRDLVEPHVAAALGMSRVLLGSRDDAADARAGRDAGSVAGPSGPARAGSLSGLVQKARHQGVARIQLSVEVDPIATIYRHEPGIGVVIFIDSTQDAFGSPVWTRVRCERWVERPTVLFRPGACDGGAVVGPPPSAEPSEVAQDGVEGLIADLQAAGAPTRELLIFQDRWPPNAQGSLVCIGDELISIYVFKTSSEREEAAGRIDPDRSHVCGRGDDRRVGGRAPVLATRPHPRPLCRGDETTEATLTSIMGQPFARRPGRPAPRDERC